MALILLGSALSRRMLNGQFLCWSFMSEVDRIFPPRAEGADVTKAGEKRFIRATSRKRGLASAQTRIVEVVHLRSSKSKPADEPRQRVVARQHAESWPDGFRAKTAAPESIFGVAPVESKPSPPTVHVMAGWDPSPKPPAAIPPPPVDAVAAGGQQPLASRRKAPRAVSRRFADPFADDDTGANCLRCGYLVERAREDRGKMTCSRCG
jgi:hypothetical protein